MTKQEYAFWMLEEARARRHEPHGVVYAGRTDWIDGQAWIHWRTADALERRGRATVSYFPPDGAEINLREMGG